MFTAAVAAVTEKAVEVAEKVAEKAEKFADQVKEAVDECDLSEDLISDELEENLDNVEDVTGDELSEDLVSDDIQEQNKGLTDVEKQELKEKTGWSDEIINNISSMEEANIYINADLTEAEINGKKCLIRNDIDWNQLDDKGRTNMERAEKGLSPINKNGETIELHHIGQHSDSPLAELTRDEHRGAGNDTILHDKTKESEIDRNSFGNNERPTHWKERVEVEFKEE